MEKKDFTYYQNLPLKEIFRERLTDYTNEAESRLRVNNPDLDPVTATNMFFALYSMVFSEFSDVILEMCGTLTAEEIRLILLKWRMENYLTMISIKKQMSTV